MEPCRVSQTHHAASHHPVVGYFSLTAHPHALNLLHNLSFVTIKSNQQFYLTPNVLYSSAVTIFTKKSHISQGYHTQWWVLLSASNMNKTSPDRNVLILSVCDFFLQLSPFFLYPFICFLIFLPPFCLFPSSLLSPCLLFSHHSPSFLSSFHWVTPFFNSFVHFFHAFMVCGYIPSKPEVKYTITETHNHCAWLGLSGHMIYFSCVKLSVFTVRYVFCHLALRSEPSRSGLRLTPSPWQPEWPAEC